MKNLRKLALAFTLATPLALAGNFGGEITVSDVNVGSQFPDIAYSNGVAHIVWTGYAPAGPDIFYRRSTNAVGSSMGPIVNLSNTAVANGNDRPQVAANGSTVVVGWNSQTDTGAIYTRRSADGGLTWQSTILTAGVEGGQYSRITDLFIDSAGRVHMVYYTDQDPPNVGLVGMVHHRMSCDGGATWSTDTAVSVTAIDGDVDNEEASIGEFGGRLYIAYRTSARGNPQGGWPPYAIVMKSGTVSGCAITNWSYPTRHVGGGMPFTHSSSYGPRVVGDASRLHIAWWDNTTGAEVMYRGGGAGASLGATQKLSSFGVNHLEPGGIASTPASASGGYEAPPAFATNGTTAWIAYSAQTGLDAGREFGVVRLRESSDNGLTWGTEQNIATLPQGATPQISVDTGNTQNLGIVWTEVATGGSARIKYRLYTLGALSGGPSLSISPNPATFANRPVGTTASATVTVLNSGTVATITSGPSIVPSSGSLASSTGDYTITNNTCGSSLGAAASCTFTLNFTAKALGSRVATISVGSNDVSSPATAQVTGTGVANGVGVNNNNLSAVVTGYYETILGRSPDAGGLNFWIGEANRMVTLGTSAPSVNEVFFAMSIQFFNSAEYLGRNTSDTQYITDLYRTFFIREPDAGGMSFWQAELSALQERNALLTNFLFSTEFNLFMSGIFGNPSVRPEINMTIDLYRGILGVLPDSAGFQFWLGQIRTAQCQGSAQVKAKVGELAAAFVNSAEYAAREAARPAAQRTRMHVSDLYNAFLRRGAESSGFNFWVNTIEGGFQTRDQVRDSFLASPEFDGRVNQVIAAGCFS